MGKVGWCNVFCAAGQNPVMGLVQSDDFSCDWVMSKQEATIFMTDGDGTPSNQIADLEGQTRLGFSILNSGNYCDPSDVLFTKQIDGLV